MTYALDPAFRDGPAMPPTVARRFQHANHWEGRIHVTGRGKDGSVVAHAELFRASTFICRIALARQFDEEEQAVDALQAKAVDWMDDWNSRQHSGDTGFTSL
jgi:hypothetical protein